MAVITDDDIALLDQKQAASKPLTDDDIARLDAQQPPKDDTPAIIKAGKNIWSGIKQSSADVQAQKTMPEMLLHLVGGAAGNLTNSLVEAAKAAYSYVPQAVKTPIENEVKGVGEAVKSNKTLSDLLLGAQQWAKDNPRAAGNIGAAVNVASVLPVGKAVEAAGKGLADVAGPAVEKAAAAIADKIPSATDKLDKAIQTGVTKGIKPTVIGKPSYDKLTNFYDKANEAVKVIAENRDKLKLVDENGEALHHPRSAAEMAQAVDQAKKVIYDKYHAMATAAGDAGSEFDTEPILKELDKVAADPEEALPMGDPRLKYNPQTRAYANDLKSEIMELHGASPDIIEARIADLNNSLKGFYDGRVTKAKAQIDGSVAKLMRQQLDDNITSAVGEGYQDLKNQYGALKTVENEVAKRALVNARKANKGVADLTDIFTGGDLVAGALSGNPALIAKGLFGRGIKEVYKSLNNPDRYIEKMFKKAYDVVPSVKDVELVKNAVAGVKLLPGPDQKPITDESLMLPAPMIDNGTPLSQIQQQIPTMRQRYEVAGTTPGVTQPNNYLQLPAPGQAGQFQIPNLDVQNPGVKLGVPLATMRQRLEAIGRQREQSAPFQEPESGLFSNQRAGSIGAYHGSPYKFDKFDASKIGSGEGNQSFGHGLYFTSEKEIADKYANDLSAKKGSFEIEGRQYDFNDADLDEDFTKANKNDDIKIIKKNIKGVEENLSEWTKKDQEKSPDDFKRHAEDLETLKAIDGYYEKTGRFPKPLSGNTYSVTLHKGKTPDQYDYIKWDEPIKNSQLNKISNQMMEIPFNERMRIYSDMGLDDYYAKGRPTISHFKRWLKEESDSGDNVYGTLSSLLGGDKAASEFLLKAGIDGIDCPAGSLSGVKSDARNYVVFDPNAVTIEKNHSSGNIQGSQSAGVLPMLGLTGATAGAIGAGGVALENALHKKDEHGQSFADILKGIFDNMQGGK